jgi:Tfp pilus assembly protein PilW
MKRMKGLTIVQLMVVLLLAGLVAKIVIEVLIDKRCESDPSTQLCADRKDTLAR